MLKAGTAMVRKVGRLPIAFKNKVDDKKDGMDISNETLIHESVMAQNLMLNYGGSSPANSLLGKTPKDFCDIGNENTSAAKDILE